ncbi:MAG: PLDc N-terminal domain-containing protein [Gammaproteobacteria bacterium]|nr:PLDc N-terminal domain-containing protein [Gammaproteobacteria bacterium]
MGLPHAAVAAVLLLVVHIGAAAVAAGHALLTKTDPHSAFGWIAVCWLFPLAGPLLYVLFGINRVRARAQRLRGGRAVIRDSSRLPESESFAAQLTRIGDAVTQWSRIAGNEVVPLANGENAFPPMLRAISAARESVWLATYIFQTDAVGRQFIDALAGAAARGVQVRVLIDGVGEWYSWPRAVRVLRRAGVRAERFLAPRLLPVPRLSINLRNHRKLLIADGQVAFLGGMNIGGREVGRAGHRRMADLHFQVRGPVIAQLARAYSIDWQFAAHEELGALAPPAAAGSAVCRVITDGPDEDMDKLLFVIVGALSVARHQILVMTPYFIPQPELTSALQAAALRGVEVCLVIPERSNLRYVDWACRRWLRPLLERGVRIWLQPAPFSHSKLLVVDGVYAQVGSANLDPRSLRLNFEIALEIYGADTCRALVEYVDVARRRARPFTLDMARGESWLRRTRNSLMWLLSPYL